MNWEKVMKLSKKLFCLPAVPTILIAIPSYIFVFYVLVYGVENLAVTYLAYILSAYALIISMTGIVRVIEWGRDNIGNQPLVKKIYGIPVFQRFVNEVEFRTEAALYQGLAINLFYVGIKLFSGIYYRSIWFITLSVYYFLLAAMRIALVSFVRKNTMKDRILGMRCYRLCGMILLFMNWALAGIVLLVVHQNSSFEYPGMLIYAMAFYTFYATVMAARNVVKFRKYGNPVMSAAKVINLTAALVSVLSLETAMLTRFGAADSPVYRQVMTISTGAGISVIVLGMAFFMIVRSTKFLKQAKREIKKEEDGI